MSEKLNNNKEQDEQILSIKERCKNCFKGPNLLKTTIIIICMGVVFQQISTCISKLIDIPITTYTHFDFNKTIAYPSITFCREPPYKYEKMLDYGLFGHPQYTSEWRYFNFSIPLDQLWRDITYEASEFFVQYGLNSEMYNVEVRETMGFTHGRCYTLTPNILMEQATRQSGMSITLQHSTEDIVNSISEHPPGYHAFLHYTREPFTEISVYNGGQVNYLFCNIGETIDVKLSVDQYDMISEDSDPCTYEDNYSANNCTTQFVWDSVAATAGCSGPWMQSSLPMCDNFESMRALIVAYTSSAQQHNCTVCPRFCRAYLYNGYVNDRHNFAWDSMSHQWISRNGAASLQTQLYLYFNSMMVSVYEERYNYDWNLFLSDLGGSVGFLLGLSVIGLMSICGKIWRLIVGPKVQPSNNKQENKESSKSSENIYQIKDLIDATNKKNLKNNYY